VVVINQNGCPIASDSIYVTIIGIADKDKLSEIKIYPNPTDGILQISFRQSVGKVEFMLFDTKGSLVFNKQSIKATDEHTELLDLSSLPLGAYHLLLKTDKQVFHFQINLVR
jgi:hypothetical protein